MSNTDGEDTQRGKTFNSDRYIPTTETDPNITMASLRKKLTNANKELASLREQLKLSKEIGIERGEQLKQQEEVIRELTSSLTYIVETLGTLSTQQDELEALAYYEALRAIQKAKSLTTKDK